VAHLVKIGERIINLDQVKFFERGNIEGELTLSIRMEALRKIHVNPVPSGPFATEGDDQESIDCNMLLSGRDAKVAWEKLCEHAEVWGLPNEMPSEDGERK
jgi:hypothetical protein